MAEDLKLRGFNFTEEISLNEISVSAIFTLDFFNNLTCVERKSVVSAIFTLDFFNNLTCVERTNLVSPLNFPLFLTCVQKSDPFKPRVPIKFPFVFNL